MSTRCPAPYRCPRCSSRTTVDSSFCAGDGAVPRLGRRQAGVAVAARLGGLAEVVEQLHAAARHGLAEREHGVEVRGQPALVGGVALGRVDHAALLHDVGQPVREPRGRRQPVASGAAGLLVVPLDGLRQVEVRDEPHVGLVDAHAERDGRDHHDPVLAQEPLWFRARTCRSRPAWYGSAGTPCSDQELRGLLDRVRGTGSRRCPRRPRARCAGG